MCALKKISTLFGTVNYNLPLKSSISWALNQYHRSCAIRVNNISAWQRKRCLLVTSLPHTALLR
uniref:Uncharacterized protein n=1 Tax=Anguilla anguilla TaxID=7936 RepID=A0A0E9PLM7_ANGAN